MDNHEDFSPETVDQQIELYLASKKGNTSAQRTVQSLQKQLAPQQDNQALDRVWARLTHSAHYPSVQLSQDEELQPISIVHYQKEKEASQKSRPSQARNFTHSLMLLFASVFLVLLVGSTALIFQRASEQRKAGYGTSVAAGNILYAVSGNTAYALDIVTQKLLWRYQLSTNAEVSHGPIKVVAGIYYIWWNDNAIYALNGEDGSFLWKYQTTEPPNDFMINSNVIYFSEAGPGKIPDNILKALNATTGTLQWEKPFITLLNISNNRLYISDTRTNTTIYALNAKNGSQLWQQSYSIPFNITGGKIANGTFYLSTLSNNMTNLYAYNAVTGQIQWQKHYDGDIRLSAVYGNTLYTTAFSIQDVNQRPHTHDGIFVEDAIEAFRAQDGSFLWEYKAPQPNGVSEPAIINGAVYVDLVNENENNGELIVLDAKTGSPLWKHPFSEKPTYLAPVEIHNTVAVGTAGGKVTILRLSDGALINTILLADKQDQRYQYPTDLTTTQ